MADEDFTFPPPDMDEESGLIPSGKHQAWMLQLIETRLNELDIDDKFIKDFVKEVTFIVNGAGMTQVRRGEVALFLGEWHELCMKFRIFKCSRKHYKALNYIETFVENLLLQNYNRSIDGWQGNHVFEQKMSASYDVRQTSQDMGMPVRKGWRERKKEKEIKKFKKRYESVPQ